MIKGVIAVLLIISMVITGCQSNRELDPEEVQLLSTQDYCLTPKKNPYDSHYIIQSQGEFSDQLGANTENEPCREKKFPKIDFSTHSLLGQYLSGGGCSSTVDPNIEWDVVFKKITYDANFQTEGDCEMLILKWIWVVVPKIPVDYSVEFQ